MNSSFVWVSDIYDPEYQDLYLNTISLLQETNIISSSATAKNQGNVESEFTVNPISTTSTQIILQNINKISLYPISFTLTTNSNNPISDWDLLGLDTIVSGIITDLCKVTVNFVEKVDQIVKDNIIKIYYPRLEQGDYIYRSSEWIANSNYHFNLNTLVGYQYLTSSPLVFLAVSNLELRLNEDDLKEINGYLFIKTGQGYNLIAQQIIDQIYYLRLKGWNSIPSTLGEYSILDNNLSLYPSIARRFEFPYLLLLRFFYFQIDEDMYIKSDVYRMINPSKWFIDSAELIKKYQLPKILFSGPQIVNTPKIFMRGLKDGENTLEIEAQVKITYLSILAYQETIKKYPYLVPWSSEVKVYPDSTISISVSSKNEVDYFNKSLMELRKEMDQWYVTFTPDLFTGLIQRWYLLTSPPYYSKGLTPIIVKINNHNYLIVNSNPRSSIILPENIDLIKVTLISALQASGLKGSDLSVLLEGYQEEYQLDLGRLERKIRGLDILHNIKNQENIDPIQSLLGLTYNVQYSKDNK